jgi:ferredoxin-type protein NapH
MSDRLSWKPALGHRALRIGTQTAMVLLIIAVPLFGGWHRLERSLLSAWHGWGHDLPPWAMDLLPRGDTAEGIYAWLQVLGGGGAFELVGIPIVDPVAGLAAILTGSGTWLAVAAWLIPVGLALALGRVWCGWLCPFGTLSRAAGWLRRYLPGKYRGWQPPQRRPLRWILLGGSLVIGALGVPGLLYLTLPHVLVQHAVYSAWLLGGGGAALGAVGGLMLAGVVFGPAIYCSSVCPTGAALRLASLGRLVRVAIEDKPSCGASCTQCDAACWLGLMPSTGDPGPDCDLCARCFANCPKTNLRLTLRRGPVAASQPPRPLAKAAVVLLAALTAASFSGRAHAEPMQTKPLLMLEAEEVHGDVIATISVVDWTGVRLSQDDKAAQEGAEISFYLARGELGEPDGRGRQKGRELYEGKLTLEIRDPRGKLVDTIEFEKPNAPRSAGIQAIFRKRLQVQVPEGSQLNVLPIAGWLPEGAEWSVPTLRAGTGWTRSAFMGGAAFLVAVGLLSLALAMRDRTNGKSPSA